jgi:hypothetical protein
MYKLINKLQSYSLNKVKLTFILISILVALQVQYIQHGWINSDSILYLEAAKLFANSQWTAGFNVFEWPFYAACIAATHLTTTLSIHHSAQLLNVIFFAISCSSFLKIIELAGGRKLELIAGAMIFLSAQYLIGGVLEMLMRDEGFWAFYLTSLVFLIKFFQQQQLKDAFLWQACIIIATLFRIEAISFLVFLPLILLIHNEYPLKDRMKLILKAYSLQFVIAITIFILLISSESFSTHMLGRLNEIFTPTFFNDLTRKMSEKSQIMAKMVLGEHLDKYAIPSLILTFCYVMLIKTINATGLINIFLSIFTFKDRKKDIEKRSYQLLVGACLIAFMNMALIITKVFVLSSRYVLALSFILMIFASFYFGYLLQHYISQKNKKYQWIVGILITFMCLGFINNLLPKQTGYNYLQDAVAWTIRNNTTNSPVFFSDARMRYYAGQPFNGQRGDSWQTFQTALKDQSIKQFDYILISVSINDKKNARTISQAIPEYTLVQEINGVRNKKKVFIFKKSDLITGN